MSPEWKIFDSTLEYSSTLKKMEKKVEEIIANESDEELWLLEHKPVYTAGTSSNPEDLLDKNNIPIFNAGRGGQYTYHGPGQRVMYLMLDLKKAFAPKEPDLRKYVFMLEQIIINTLDDFDIKGERREGRIGIWVSNKGIEEKIAAIGIRVRKWVSFHGIAINVNPDLKNYQGIVPCGISEYGVCSFQSLGKKISLKQLDNRLKYNFYKIFSSYKNV
ncbi:MAG: lipoyl(octanoyl) transferase LipB [Rickettsiales bacterium]